MFSDLFCLGFATCYVGWDVRWLRVSYDLFAGLAGNECCVRE